MSNNICKNRLIKLFINISYVNEEILPDLERTILVIRVGKNLWLSGVGDAGFCSRDLIFVMMTPIIE